MSVLAVSDLVFSDLLSQLDMKPWWAKIRGYCFAVSVASALSMMYIVLSSTTIDCIPLVAENVTTCTTISAAQANFVNNYCYNQLPFYVSIFIFSPLLISIVILMASSYWTLYPDVINSFHTFAEFKKMVTDLNLTFDQICDMSSEIINSEESIKIRKACSLLWKYESSTNVGRHYKKRNMILFSVTLFSFAIAVYILYFLFVDNSNFECFIDFDSKITRKANVIKQQFCSHNKLKILQPYMLAFAISLFVQEVFTVVGGYFVRSTVNRITNDKKGFFSLSQGVTAAKYSFFMMLFWKNSKSTSWQNLDKLVHYIFHEAIIKIENNLEKAILDDTEMILMYCNLRKNGGKHVIDLIMKEIKKDTFSVNSKQHAGILRCIKHLKPILNFSSFRDFIECLSELKLWELLANVLVAEYSDWVKGYIDMDYIPEPIIININEIGQPYDLERSILYYFNPDGIPLNSKAASILSRLEYQYVHYDGESKPVEYYQRGSYLGKLTNKNINIMDRYVHRLQSGDLSQQQINRICERHIKKTQEFKEKLQNSENEPDEKAKIMSEYVKYLENLSKEVSRYKFDKWDKNIDKLAQFANSEEQWVLLVALFNTYIINSYKNLETDCSVREFTLISKENRNTSPPASILYHVLRKPQYLKHLQSNAIRYILIRARGQERNVRKPDGKIVSAAEYVKENDALTSDEKDYLLLLLESYDNISSHLRKSNVEILPTNDENPGVPGSSTEDSRIPPSSFASAPSLQIIEENPDVPGSSTEDSRIPPASSASAPSLRIIDEKSDKVIVVEPPNDENRDGDSDNMNIDEGSCENADEPLITNETTSV